MANQRISELTTLSTPSGDEYVEVIVSPYTPGTNRKTLSSNFGPTKEFNRAFSETLVFDKNEIEYAPHVATGNITFEVGSGNLVNQNSVITVPITFTGSQTLNFGPGFTYLNPTTLNGSAPAAGTYEVYFWYSNGTIRVIFNSASSQSSGAVTLAAPSSFAAVADGETALDLSWANVTNNEGYLIEFSLTGTGGWATLETTAIDAVASTQTGLSAGNTRYYRIKTLGDGVNFLDSAFSNVISGQTESSGDVTAPTFVFLPANGNTVWPVNKVITITANEPIRNTDGSVITDANVASRITLKQTNSGGANIAFTATIDSAKEVITITPTTQYGEAQLVYVAINNVEDVNGNEVTVAVSITFTTTDYTFFNGTTNRSQFGDILDSLWAAPSANFWLEVSVRNMLLSGSRALVTKYATTGNQRSFQWYAVGTDVYFTWSGTTTGDDSRAIKWTNVLTAGDHTLVLKYDGAIITGDGLDRLTLLIDAGTAGSKTLFSSVHDLTPPANATAQLAVGAYINSAGTPIGTNFYTEELKDFIVRSTAGAVVEINVPNLKTGTDTSGNSRNGTWV